MKLSFSILRSGDFRLFVAARLCGAMALQAQAVVVGWQIYSITHDPFMLGLIGLTEALPALVGALISGHIVDTHRPYRVLLACIGGLVINTLYLYLVGSETVHVPGENIVPFLFVGVFFSGLMRCFIMPASYSLQPRVVQRSDFSQASAWTGAAFHLGTIGGPAIAGIIYGMYGAHVAWLMPVSLLSVMFVILGNISAPVRHYKSDHVREAMSTSIKAGWKFIWNNNVLLAVMALDMFAVLFGGAVAMLPAFAEQILFVGPEGLGALRAAPALGAITGAFILATFPLKHIRATTLFWAVCGFGVCMIGFGLSHAFWLSMALLALSGLFDSASMVIRQTLVQWITPDAMRGRVSSVNSMFIISSNEIGAFESGLAARLLGLATSVVFGGICTLGVVAITAGSSPKLRRTVVTSD